MISKLFSGFLPYAIIAALLSGGAAFYLFKKNIQLKAEHKAEIAGLEVAIRVQNDAYTRLNERLEREKEIIERLNLAASKDRKAAIPVKIEVAKSTHECADESVSDVLGDSIVRFLRND